MKSGKVLVVYFVTGLFHYFSGKLFNECTIKNYESVASQTEVLFYYYEFTEENFSSSTGHSIASLSLFAATSLLESLIAQLSMCCFIKFTACVITSFLSHQINLKAAWFLTCQVSKNLSILCLNILTLCRELP